MEIELKLSVPPSAMEALLKLPLVASAPIHAETCQLLNVYYDTPELDLYDACVALRTRKTGNTWLQTIKCASPSTGGLSSRPEWESPYVKGQFDFSAVTSKPTEALLVKYAKKIAPVFSTDFDREVRILEISPETQVLLMIDQGKIKAGRKTAPVCEVELELVKGDPLVLFEIAQSLAESLPLIPEDASKAERGYRLFIGTPKTPEIPSFTRPHPDQTPLEAFRALSFSFLRAWQENVSSILSPSPLASEFILHYAYSVKSLNKLLTVFAPALNISFVKHWQAVFTTLRTQAEEVLHLTFEKQHIDSALFAFDFEEKTGTYAQLVRHKNANERRAIKRLQKSLSQTGVLMLAYAHALHNIQEESKNGSLETFAQKTFTQLSKQAKETFKRVKKEWKTDDTELPYALHEALGCLNQWVDIFEPLFKKNSLSRYQDRLYDCAAHFSQLKSLHEANTRLDGFIQKELDPKRLEVQIQASVLLLEQEFELKEHFLKQAKRLLKSSTPL